MIPASFDYVRATSVEHALTVMSQGATPLAGGHSLLLEMKYRQVRPATVIDISALEELSVLQDGGDHLVIGAAVTYSRLERSELVHAAAPLLAHSASTVGDRQVRVRGTVGGSVVNADPSADLPATLMALGANYVLRGPDGVRQVPADQMHPTAGCTALRPGELVTQVLVPAAGDRAWSYQKFRQRSHQWAVVGVAALASGGGEGPSLALMGVGPTTRRARASEEAVAGGADLRHAATLASQDGDVVEDARASAHYRRHLAEVMVRRALGEITPG